MNLIFIGPQGSGKGTQAQIISKRLNIAHISASHLIRNYEGSLKHEIDEIINGGGLISNPLTVELIKQRLEKLDCQNGFILDGFPRTLEQAELSKSLIKVDKVIEIDISDNEAVKRLSTRLTCNKCGFVYIQSQEVKENQECLNCQKGLLIKRADDYKESIRKRLEIYHKETKPILEFYKDKLIKINGEQSIEKVKKDILKKLNV